MYRQSQVRVCIFHGCSCGGVYARVCACAYVCLCMLAPVLPYMSVILLIFPPHRRVAGFQTSLSLLISASQRSLHQTLCSSSYPSNHPSQSLSLLISTFNSYLSFTCCHASVFLTDSYDPCHQTSRLPIPCAGRGAKVHACSAHSCHTVMLLVSLNLCLSCSSQPLMLISASLSLP